MVRIFSPNNAESTLAGAITTGSTSFSVAAGHGVRFGTAPFVVTIDSEIIYVGTRTTDAFSNLVRAYEAVAGVQTPAAHSAGAAVKANPTGGQLTNLYNQMGLYRIDENINEVAITSTTTSDLMTFSGLNISTQAMILVTGLIRKDATGTNAAQLGLGLNATNYDPLGSGATDQCLMSTTALATVQQGWFKLWLPPRRTNYLRAGYADAYLTDTNTVRGFSYRAPFHSADCVSATITSIRIRGRLTPATGTGAWVRDVNIYTDLL